VIPPAEFEAGLNSILWRACRLLVRGWAAGQPELIGDDTNQRVAIPQVNSVFYANPEVTQPLRTDHGSEGWGFESLRACC
jgi:hypothetical protein